LFISNINVTILKIMLLIIGELKSFLPPLMVSILTFEGRCYEEELKIGKLLRLKTQ